MAMFKGFKPEGLQKIANSMGYTGSLEGFDSYLQQNPNKQNMMNMYNQRAVQMAQGGMPTYVNPITPKKDPNNLMGPVGAAVMSYGYNPTTNQYSISGGGGQQFGEGFESSRDMNELYKKYPQLKGTFEKGRPQPSQGSLIKSLGLSDEQARQITGGGFPAQQQPNPATQARLRDRGFGQDVGGFPAQEPRYQGTDYSGRSDGGRSEGFPSPIASQNQRLAPWLEGYDFDFGNLDKSFEERNADLDKREREYKEANPNWRQILKDRASESDTPLPIIPPQQPQVQYPKSYMSGYTTQDGKAIEAPFKSSRSPLEIYTTKEDYANYASKTYDDRRAYYNNQIKKLTDQGFVLQADGYYRNPKTGGASRIGGFDDVLNQSKEQYVAKQLEAKNRYDAERANSPAGSLDFREQQKASELKRDKENVSKLNENLIKQGLSPIDANFYDSPEYKYYLDNRSMVGMPASGFSKYFGPQSSQEAGGTREKAYEAYLKRTGQDDIINKANNFRDPNIGFGIQELGPVPIDQQPKPNPSIGAINDAGKMTSLFIPDTSKPRSEEDMRNEWEQLKEQATQRRRDGFVGQVVLPGEGSYEDWARLNKFEMMRNPEASSDMINNYLSVGQPNINTSQPTGTTMATDTNIEDFSVQQALNPTLPQGGATVAAGTPITQDQMVDPATGQLRPQAPTVGSAALGTTTTSTAPTATPASTMDASLSNLNVTQALQPIQSAQGSVSQQSQMTAQQQTDSKVSDLQAAQGAATLMQNPVQREIQAGELISGGAANAEKASTYAEQIEAATATPSAQATVQGQLANLTADFDATNPPAWAAGALRGVQAQMAARGLGTSSMAAQAMVQGALESALPIAQADAQTRASFEAANLSNRQQRAMLAAQQRAAFIGQEFDQEFQTRVQNAAKISDIANMNFTAEQQIALENSRAANTMGLANLSNRQAMVMAEASALANLDMSNLNNRQQAAVQNAQAFMQMDMANLNNSQQTGMFKAQSLVQSLFNDQSATNASRQFNASSQNQTDQFFANLSATVANFNAEQANAMSRYNSGELNALEQFNANMKNQREQFNAQNRLVIDQSNAQWRRQVATADTAAINRANELNARALIDMSTGAYNNLWQGFRDDMEFAWKSADNAEERNKDILLRKMQDESTVAAAALAADQALVDNLVTGLVGLSTADTGTTMVGKAFDAVSSIDYKGLWDTGKGVVDKIINWF